MAPEITIRRLGPRDVDEYIRLRREGVMLDPVAFGKARATEMVAPRAVYLAFLAPSSQRMIWGAFRGARLVGMVRLQEEGCATWRAIHCLYVCPAERHQGLSRRLLQVALARAQHTPGVCEIRLSFESTNLVARNLYRSVGFEEWAREENTFSIDGAAYSECQMRKFIHAELVSRALAAAA